jgi:phage terminase large subunit
MIWTDPLLKPIPIPDNLSSRWSSIGTAKFQLLPSQYGFLQAQEEFVGYIGGYGSGKTRVGSIKAATLAAYFPGNRGLVGMAATTDLDKSAQRDLMEFLYEAGLVKKAPTSKDGTVYVHCIDPKTGENLGYESEIEFAFLDDPKHVRGRHLGWVWIDEGSQLRDGKGAFQNLLGRLRLPVFKGRYKAIVTGNPEGHNWIYDFFFNKELIEALSCKLPSCKFQCRMSEEGWRKCNRATRLKRRAFHCTSMENYFLPPDYLDNMRAGMSDEDWERYVMASFDIFEGQIFKEWREDTHVLFPEGALA